MSKGIKIANPGINALTNTDPKNFSLFVDGSADHILVKEKARGTQEVASSDTASITHSLNYFPFNMQFVEVSAGEFEWIYNAFGGAYNSFYSYVTTSALILGNEDASAVVFTYIIFYDQL